MKKFTANELRKLYFEFFKDHGHQLIPSASLIPENDPSVLFTTAGMHPLVPYLNGEKHPKGTRLVDVQKCVRTGDIDEVGDFSHLTFFEMLGNWSLGDYFKEDMIRWSYEFLTSEKYLAIPKEKLAVTVFAGNELAPRDEESAKIWKECGMHDDQIFYLKDNWWILGSGLGPCGPDSEMFVDTGKPKCCPECNPSCSCGKYLEIWNDVFMQFKVEKAGEPAKPLSRKNVDTGMGLERTLCILNGVGSVYETEVFQPAIKQIETLSNKQYNHSGDENTKSFRVIADHIRSATAILGDERGISPSNTGAGYVLRRLIRKAIRHSMRLNLPTHSLGKVASVYCEQFKDIYPELKRNESHIIDELNLEEDKFLKTIDLGLKEFDKVVSGIEKFIAFSVQNNKPIPQKIINGKAAFRLYDTFGFPIELTQEIAKEKGYEVDIEGFNKCYQEHQELARTTSAGSFKGGLADHSKQSARLHTATHLLQAGLRKLVKDDIHQKGSNITPERLRFDFNCDHKLTDEEKQKVEDFVNEAIKRDIPVVCEEMTLEKARESGAFGIFENKYGDLVKVYTIGDVSKEICGGPHASSTGELKGFKIIKEEASSSGVRRIKAVILANPDE